MILIQIPFFSTLYLVYIVEFGFESNQSIRNPLTREVADFCILNSYLQSKTVGSSHIERRSSANKGFRITVQPLKTVDEKNKKIKTVDGLGQNPRWDIFPSQCKLVWRWATTSEI